MWKLFKSTFFIGPLTGVILMQMAYTSSTYQPHVDGGEKMMTTKAWTAHELGRMAMGKKMAAVVSDIVGSSPKSGLSTTTASSRKSFWERIDLATIEDIRASILQQTARHRVGKGNKMSGSRTTLARFARSEDAAATCATAQTPGGRGPAVCISQCENKRSFFGFKGPHEGACHLLCALAVAPCDKGTTWGGWASNGVEKIDTIIDQAVPPAYSNMARGMARDAVAAFRACLSASVELAGVAKMILDGVTSLARTIFYPWACAVAKDAANIVTTNVVSLSRAAFRSSSAGLSAALELFRDLSGSASVGAAEVAATTAASLQEGTAAVLGAGADMFWSSPAGRMVTARVTPLLEEGATAVLDATGAFWARPAMVAVRETVVPLFEKGATTVVKAVFQLWRSSAVVKGKRLVKTHLLDDRLVSVLLLVLAVRAACHFRKLRVTRAGLHARAKEESSELQQAKALNNGYADNFRKSRDQRKALYRLRNRAVEASRRKSLEADRAACRVGLENAVGVDGGGSGTGDDGGAAQGSGGSGAGGVGAPSSGNPARGSGNAEEGNGNAALR